MTVAVEGGEWSAARPGRTLPPGKTRYPLYRRLGGPQGRSGQTENLVPTGIRSPTVQRVVQSLYRMSHPTHSSSSRHKILLRIGLCYLLAFAFRPHFPVSAHLDARYVALPRSKGPQFAVIPKPDVIAEICERYRRCNILGGGSSHIACLECVVTPVV